MFIEHRRIVGTEIMALNLFTALVLASYFALGLRALVLLIVDRGRKAPVVGLRACAVAGFLALGCLYAAFSAPLMMWDKPSRGVAVTLVFTVVLADVYLHEKGRPERAPRLLDGVVVFILFVGLALLGMASLMRVGFVTLTGDRVTYLVDVTGETKSETFPWKSPDASARDVTVVAHRVLFTSPYGKDVADLWIYGDNFVVKGRALLLSSTLNRLWFPNLYELEEVHNGYFRLDTENPNPAMSIPFPHNGPLSIHPWWAPIEARLYHFWHSHLPGGSLLGLRSADSESPAYPLVDADGKPAHKRFLLVLEPWGLPTSRGSSPFEKKGAFPRF